MDDDDSAANLEWRWGPRTHAEIGEEAIAKFMTQFMKLHYIDEKRVELGIDDDEENEEDARRKKTAAANKRADKLADLEEKAEKYEKRVYKDIVRGAGGNLTDIKTD